LSGERERERKIEKSWRKEAREKLRELSFYIIECQNLQETLLDFMLPRHNNCQGNVVGCFCREVNSPPLGFQGFHIAPGKMKLPRSDVQRTFVITIFAL
jgi:hypothetical protein